MLIEEELTAAAEYMYMYIAAIELKVKFLEQELDEQKFRLCNMVNDDANIVNDDAMISILCHTRSIYQYLGTAVDKM